MTKPDDLVTLTVSKHGIKVLDREKRVSSYLFTRGSLIDSWEPLNDFQRDVKAVCNDRADKKLVVRVSTLLGVKQKTAGIVQKNTAIWMLILASFQHQRSCMFKKLVYFVGGASETSIIFSSSSCVLH